VAQVVGGSGVRAGGCGKTRLALRVAALAEADFGDGARLVELAPLTDPALVPASVARALDVSERDMTTPTAGLARALAGRVRGRHAVRGPGRGGQSRIRPDGAQLGCGRAGVRPARRYPLGYRAGRGPVPGFGTFRAGRAAGWPSRAAVRRSGPPGRHRSLEELVAWSYDLLDEAERRLLARLSVLGGRFGLGTVERVAADELQRPEAIAGLLASLADKSVVHIHDGAAVRYSLLETIR
jgi:predicted ATPase